MSQPHRNQSIVKQPTAFKSKGPRISKPWCDSQVDMNYDLSKPITTHNLLKEREAASAKPHHMIASSNSRISIKNKPRFSSNDMVHNHYLEAGKPMSQPLRNQSVVRKPTASNSERPRISKPRNSEPSLIPSARLQSTADGSKPMPRRNTQTSRNWPASKNSFVM
nr:hypothetical protein [Tanacetum cinerariifolium]